MTDHLLKMNLNFNITRLLYVRKTIKVCIKKNTVNNINLDEYDKILKDYINSHNKKFNVYLVNCGFKIEFDNVFIINIETSFVHNIESKKMKNYLIY